ncbi:MAG: prolipoprotein diacylglyceryl transferase [Salibacteraceae bacterium]
MFPKLFEIGDFTIYSYGFFIVLGATLAYFHMAKEAKRLYGIDSEKISTLLLWIIAMAFIGGKVLFYLEDPGYYVSNPSAMWDDLGNGFVFFGSLLFGVPVVIWFFKKNNWNVWGMLDITAFSVLIVHAFGRLGCFLAGCCHGNHTDSWLGVVYTDPACQAELLNTPLHPTQLYAVVLLASIFFLLKWIQKNKKIFDGQLFLIYVILYSLGRGVIEEFRGDEARGYIFDGWFSHSQLISSFLIIIALVFYSRRLTAIKKTNS